MAAGLTPVTVTVSSDRVNGGWRVDCKAHGLVTSRADTGNAERDGYRHIDRAHFIAGGTVKLDARPDVDLFGQRNY